MDAIEGSRDDSRDASDAGITMQIIYDPPSNPPGTSAQTSLDLPKPLRRRSTKKLRSARPSFHETTSSKRVSDKSSNTSSAGDSGVADLNWTEQRSQAEVYFKVHKDHLKLKNEHAALQVGLRDLQARFKAIQSTNEILEDDKKSLVREKRILREENQSLRYDLQKIPHHESTKATTVLPPKVSSDGGDGTEDLGPKSSFPIRPRRKRSQTGFNLPSLVNPGVHDEDDDAYRSYHSTQSAYSEKPMFPHDANTLTVTRVYADQMERFEENGNPHSLGFRKKVRQEMDANDVWARNEDGAQKGTAIIPTQPVDNVPNTIDGSSTQISDTDPAQLQLDVEMTDPKSVKSEISELKAETGGHSDETYTAADTMKDCLSPKVEDIVECFGDTETEATRAAAIQIDSTSLEEANVFSSYPNESGTTVTTPTLQVSCHSTENGLKAHDVFLPTKRTLWWRLLRLLVSIGLREHDVLPGHQRVRWKDAHGKTLYDDYQELEPDGLKALEAYLNSAAYRSHHQSSTNQVPATSGLSRRATQTNLSGSSNTSDQVSNSLPVKSRFLEDLEKGNSSSDGEGKPPRTLDLIVCVGRGYKDELLPESVIHIENDQQLFRALRDSYKTHVGRARRICSLKTVGSIHFMMLGYGGPGDLEVRCHNDLCHEPRCHCIPPVELVGSEYLCNPVPTPLSPPVGPRLMMSFFTDPDAMNPNQRRILNQLPKRTSGNLDSDYAEGVTKAWGIYYEEDWNWAKIWWILGLAFFPPSFLFGILWGVLKQDIQGAFGVASWWMAGASIVIGIVGTSTWAK